MSTIITFNAVGVPFIYAIVGKKSDATIGVVPGIIVSANRFVAELRLNKLARNEFPASDGYVNWYVSITNITETRNYDEM